MNARKTASLLCLVLGEIKTCLSLSFHPSTTRAKMGSSIYVRLFTARSYLIGWFFFSRDLTISQSAIQQPLQPLLATPIMCTHKIVEIHPSTCVGFFPSTCFCAKHLRCADLVEAWVPCHKNHKIHKIHHITFTCLSYHHHDLPSLFYSSNRILRHSSSCHLWWCSW